MAVNTPYAQLTGVHTYYVAVAGTAKPNIDATPGVAWTELGCTDGDQVYDGEGDLTLFYDNCHQGPVKTVRGQEDYIEHATLVDLTLEKLAFALGQAAGVIATTTSGAEDVKRLPHRKGPNPTEYALLVKASTDSPYGAFPAQRYYSRGVFEGTFARTRGKTARDAVEFMYRALEDDTAASGMSLGYTEAQIN